MCLGESVQGRASTRASGAAKLVAFRIDAGGQLVKVSYRKGTPGGPGLTPLNNPTKTTTSVTGRPLSGLSKSEPRATQSGQRQERAKCNNGAGLLHPDRSGVSFNQTEK
jgi:hypothetical protein